MNLKSTLLGAAIAVLPAIASAHMEIENVVARVASPVAQTAAIYMTVRNHGDLDDRLFRVEGEVAERIEIHTTVADDAGVMRMMELEDGITIASGDTHALRPGGDHIMLLGLTGPLEQGDTFDIIVYFDEWIPETVTVTVDNEAAQALAGEGAMSMEIGDGDHMGHGDSDG